MHLLSLYYCNRKYLCILCKSIIKIFDNILNIILVDIILSGKLNLDPELAISSILGEKTVYKIFKNYFYWCSLILVFTLTFTFTFTSTKLLYWLMLVNLFCNLLFLKKTLFCFSFWRLRKLFSLELSILELIRKFLVTFNDFFKLDKFRFLSLICRFKSLLAIYVTLPGTSR